MQQQVTYQGSSFEQTNIELNNVRHPQQQQPGYLQTQNSNSEMQKGVLQGYPAADPMLAQAPDAISYNPNTFAACNQGIANGFGAMFFNVRDPSFTQQNIPVKQNSSLHLPVVIFNVIFMACLIVGLIGLGVFLDIGAMIGMIVGSYLVYLIIGCCCSDIKDYVQNTKKFDDFQATYNQMVRGKGFFRFWIQCYHYVTVRTKNGTRRRKVVTHTATEIFRPTETTDESGEVTSISDVTSHVFLHYLKRYYFTDDASQSLFISAFNNFVSRNTRDVHQNYSHTFDIQGFQEYVSFTALGEGGKSTAFFYIFTILGLAFPYACIFERTVSRYDVGILKRLTV